jgi:subtilisin family serine protease
MKFSTIIGGSLLLLCHLSVWGQSRWNTQTVPLPAQQYYESSSEEYMGVWLLLADRVDVLTLDEGFYEQQLSLAERGPRLIPLLQEKARQTQIPLLQYLEQLPGVQANSISPLWATNAIYCKANLLALQKLSQRPELEHIEPDLPVRQFDIEEQSAAPMKPDGREFHHDSTRASFLWELGYYGYGQSALIIDSGVDGTHPSLAGNFRGQYVGNNQAWFDRSGNTPQPNDCGTHGTHVAGIVVGIDPLTNDTTGAAPDATWMGAPALRGGNCSGSQFTIQSLQWALNPDGDPSTVEDMPAVINNSWGTPYDEVSIGFCTSVWQEVLNSLEAAGIAVVFAAGNDGNDGDTTISGQAGINTNLVNSFSVGLINSNNWVVWYSSRGPSNCGGTGSLEIKPEVSAYGAAIRAAEAGGGYIFQTGTSMSAPVVSGNLLLLKEAFPYLTGQELKLALYFTATDLGIAGEDNTYGMGVINTQAAYQYLIDQGHVPATVSDFNDVVLKPILNVEEEICGSSVQPVLELVNRGKTAFNDIWIHFSYGPARQDSLHWTGSLAVDSTLSLSLPTEELNSGGHELQVEITRVNGQADYHYLDNRARRSFVIRSDAVSAIAGDTICQGTEGMLSVVTTGKGTVVWYDQETGGQEIATGSAWITPPLQNDTTVYAAVEYRRQAGKIDPLAGDGYFDQDGDLALVFDAATPFVLKSVLVRSQSDGVRLIELRDGTGNVIASKFTPINIGARVIPLDFAVPMGKNMRLVLSGTANLYVSTSQVYYPYGLPGVLSIKRSSSTVKTFSTYPYFFAWEIEYPGSCERIPVSAVVASGTAQPAFTADATQLSLPDSTTVQFTDQSIGGTQWLWNFGDGDTSHQQNPVHTYAYTGTYPVGLSVVGADGCASATSLTIEVGGINTAVEDLNQAGSLQLYPNPSQERIWFEFPGTNGETYELAIINLEGRSLLRESFRLLPGEIPSLGIDHLSTGLYFLQIRQGSQTWTAKFVKR